MFSLAQKSLEKHPHLSKVILMEHPPRFDNNIVDPNSLKPNLAWLVSYFWTLHSKIRLSLAATAWRAPGLAQLMTLDMWTGVGAQMGSIFGAEKAGRFILTVWIQSWCQFYLVSNLYLTVGLALLRENTGTRVGKSTRHMCRQITDSVYSTQIRETAKGWGGPHPPSVELPPSPQKW